MKTAQQMAAAWGAAMANPSTSTNYINGVKGVTESPMAKAATPEAQARYAQNTALAVSSGRMAARLNAVPLSLYQTNATTVGAQRLASGAQKAQPKVNAFFAQWAPIYAQASSAGQALPKGGMANALARVQAAIGVMMAAANKG